MPSNTVKVDRTTKFGNPFKVEGDALAAVAMFREWLEATGAGRELAAAARAELRGKNLACWCRPGDACHADVLLQVANE